MAQSIKHPTLDFRSGRAVRVVKLSPALGSTLSEESVKESLPVPVPLPLPLTPTCASTPTLSCALTLSNKEINL